MDVIRRIFLITVFLMPFLQGLYFYHEILLVAGLITVLLLATCFIQKGLFYEKGIILLFLVILFVFYGVSCFYAVDYGMAIIGALKIGTYFLFYLLYIQVYTDDLKEELIKAFIYSGVISSVLGIISFFIPELSGYFIQNGRLGDVFQYANTYALYCVVGIVLLIRQQEKSFFEIWLMIILVISAILTFSRSMIIIGLIAVILGMLYERKQWIKHLMGIGTGCLVAATMIKVLGLDLISQRLAETSANASEWVIRMVYYKDAVNMILKYPFGTGYLGYSFIQRMYQTSSTYQVKFVHSNLLQYGLDIGILGMIICIAFFIYLIIFNKTDFYLKMIIVMIALHGLIDFDFQFSVIIIMILVFAGIERDVCKITKGLLGQIITVTGLFIIYLYMGIAMLSSYNGDFKRAYSLYPYFTEAKIKELMSNRDDIYYRHLLAESIIQQNSFAVEAVAFERDYYFNNSNNDTALTYALQAIKLNPLNIKYVETYSNVLIKCSEEAISQSNFEEAKEYLDMVKSIPLYLQQLAKERVTDYNIKHAPDLVMTDILKANDQKADQLYRQLD